MMEMFPHQICKVDNQPLFIYCFDCNCHDFTVKSHLGHNYEFTKVAASELKDKLIEHLEPLKEVKVSLSHAVKEIQSTQSEVKIQRDSLDNIIENSFDHLHHIIEQRKQELLKEVAMKVAHKLDCLSAQEKSLSTECAMLQCVIEHTEQHLEHLADNKVLCMHAEIDRQIDEEIKEHCKEGRSLDPVEVMNIGVDMSCAADLKQLCQTKARITSASFQCTVKGKGMKTAEINRSSEFSLIVDRNSNEKYPVDCQLKTLVNGYTIKCKVDLVKENEYHIQYTPTFRGQHELVVRINRQEVAGSPFPVLVSIPPSQMGKPVRDIRCLANPCFTAINSVGETIVTEVEGDIVVFNRQGKKLRKIKSSDYNIKDPIGVAIDETDSIYIADYEDCKIVKFSKEMILLKKVSVKPDSHLFGVAVVGDEVMMCDNKHNCIMVYTKELEYVRQIGSRGKGPGKFDNIRDISSDEHGNLYVSDAGNHRIQVLSNNGKYLHSIGCDGNWPLGVCVSGQYVYIVNNDNHNISVYTTMGEYMTILGQKGSNEGEYNSPWGVCADKDGYIYICDNGNYRVQIL